MDRKPSDANSPTRHFEQLKRLDSHHGQLSQRLSDTQLVTKETDERIAQLRQSLQTEARRADELRAALQPAEASGVTTVVDAVRASLDLSKVASERLHRDFDDSTADGKQLRERAASLKLAQVNCRCLTQALRAGTVDNDPEPPTDPAACAQQGGMPQIATPTADAKSGSPVSAPAAAAAGGGSADDSSADDSSADDGSADDGSAEAPPAEQAAGPLSNEEDPIEHQIDESDPNLAGIESWISNLMAVPGLELEHVSRVFALVQSYRSARSMNARLIRAARTMSQRIAGLEELCSGMPSSARSAALLTVAQAGDVHRARVLQRDAVDASWTAACDSEGRSPLLVAAARGHLDFVRYLVSIGASKSAKVGKPNPHTHGRSPSQYRKMATHLAAAAGHQHVAAALVEAGVAASAQDEQQKNVLHYATASQGTAANCRALVAAIPLDQRQSCLMCADRAGRIPLHYATWHAADDGAVRELLNAYAEADCLAAALSHTDSQGWLPLHLSAWHSSTLRSVTALLDCYTQAGLLDASLAQLGRQNSSFLAILTHYGAQSAVVSLLLDALDRSRQLDVALEQLDSKNNSPLHSLTANSARADAVEDVLQAFEDAQLLASKLMAVNSSGRLPLHNAIVSSATCAGAVQTLMRAYERTDTFQDAIKQADSSGRYPMRA